MALLSKVAQTQPIRLNLARLRCSDGQLTDCGWSMDVPLAAETIQYGTILTSSMNKNA